MLGLDLPPLLLYVAIGVGAYVLLIIACGIWESRRPSPPAPVPAPRPLSPPPPFPPRYDPTAWRRRGAAARGHDLRWRRLLPPHLRLDPLPPAAPRRRRSLPLRYRRRLWAWSVVWQRGTCALCGKPIPAEYDGRTCHLDHDDPWGQGGPDTPENMQATHARCNLRKGGSRVRSRRARLGAAP